MNRFSYAHLASHSMKWVTGVTLGIGLGFQTTVAMADSSPEDSIMHAVEALKNNDLEALIRSSVGDAEFEKFGDEWERSREQQINEMTEQDKAEFEGFMALLVTPGSEDLLLAMVEPQLAQLQTGLMQFVALFQGMGAMQIQQLTDVDEEGKANLTAALNATAEWVTSNDLTNRDKAKEAIAMVVAKARSLDLNSLEDIANLSYENMLGKASEILELARDVLTNYGIEVDTLLDSIEVETLRNDGERAVVATRFEFLGTPQEIESTLVLQDGKWISEEALQQAQMLAVLSQLPSSDNEVQDNSYQTSSSASVSSTAIGSVGDNALSRLQLSLRENPFLQQWNIDFDVIGVSNGFATLKLNSASAGLLDAVKQGQDLTRMDVNSLPIAEDRMAVNALRNVLDTLSRRGDFESVMILP